MNRTAVVARLNQFEGCVPHLYRCTGGAVTVGIGHAIASADDCCRLVWIGPASPDQIRSGYAQVAAAPKGLVASSYQQYSQMRMAQDAINQLLAADIVLFEGLLAKALPNWGAYPEPAQEALFDMAYNLGIGGLLKFKKLIAAVNAGNWQTAAQQCHRMGIGDARNAATTALFEQCGNPSPA